MKRILTYLLLFICFISQGACYKQPKLNFELSWPYFNPFLSQDYEFRSLLINSNHLYWADFINSKMMFKYEAIQFNDEHGSKFYLLSDTIKADIPIINPEGWSQDPEGSIYIVDSGKVPPFQEHKNMQIEQPSIKKVYVEQEKYKCKKIVSLQKKKEDQNFSEIRWNKDYLILLVNFLNSKNIDEIWLEPINKKIKRIEFKTDCSINCFDVSDDNIVFLTNQGTLFHYKIDQGNLIKMNSITFTSIQRKKHKDYYPKLFYLTKNNTTFIHFQDSFKRNRISDFVKIQDFSKITSYNDHKDGFITWVKGYDNNEEGIWTLKRNTFLEYPIFDISLQKLVLD